MEIYWFINTKSSRKTILKIKIFILLLQHIMVMKKNLAIFTQDQLGFQKIGFTDAKFYKDDQEKLYSWIDNNYQGSMVWINRRKEERGNILKYFPEVKTVISFGFNYFSGRGSQDISKEFKFSNYAWGDDYHLIIKKYLFEIVAFMETMIYTPEKLYSFSLVNDNPTAFADQISTLRETTESFEVIPIVLSDVVVDKMDSDVEVYTGKDMTKEEFLTMAAENQEQYDKEQGGGCLIATAAYGSEMAPQVQFLREIRDGKIMATESGTAFMTGFNQFYYSFSPAVADYERENPMFKEAVKVTLTPLLTSLAILNYVDIDTEQEMLGYGIGVILLNIGMYFVAPAAVIIAIKNRRK